MNRKLYKGKIMSIVLSLLIVLCQSAYAALPPCTNSIADTDNDGINDNDIDKDGDGLIEICDLDGLNEIRHRLDGEGYKSNPTTDTITTGCPANVCRGYELTRNLDFTTTSSYRVGEINTGWTEGMGWLPIGSTFEASFHGNGHTISNLLIGRGGGNRIGLFANTSMGSSMTAVHLSNVDITGNNDVGGLVGENSGRITNSSVTGGSVNGSGDNVGGFIGENRGLIRDSHATGSVSGSARNMGGFIGTNNGSVINSYHVTGSVTGSSNNVGGFIGINSGPIINSYHAIGSVTGSGNNVGGFIGLINPSNTGNIINSYATGNVVGAEGSENVGGFVGRSGINNRGSIINSYATGDVTGAAGVNNVGGFIGFIDSLSTGANQGNIINSFATGDVTGEADKTGGFIGAIDDNVTGVISDNYATGNISGNTKVGGFVGEALSTAITNVYAVAKVSGNTDVGGLVGFAGEGFVVDNGYWDSGRSGTEMSAGGEARTTVDLQSTEIGEGIYERWSGTDWDSRTSSNYPILKYTSSTSVLSSPACVDEGQPNDEDYPICGDFVGGVRVLTLKTLRLSEVGGSTNLIIEDFAPNTTTYTLIVTPDITTIEISLEPDDSEAAVKANDMAIDISTKTEIQIQGISVLPITVKSGQFQLTYSVNIERAGVCDIGNIDMDDDGLIDLCWPIGLDAIRHQLDGSRYKLDADADAPTITAGCNYNNTGTCRGYELDQALDLAGEMNWQPIGSRDARFAAIFDGNNHTISNLRITTTFTNVGLFAYTAQNSTIMNVGLLSVNVGGGQHVGSLVGTNSGTISNSYARGTVSATGSNAGGFIGTNSGTISNSYAECEVTGGSEGGRNTGGFIGTNSGTITDSYAAGNVTGGAIPDRLLGGISSTGGFIGLNSGAVRNSYATGDVTVATNQTVIQGVGGFIGFIQQRNSSDIINSYAMGDVTLERTGVAGGFIGYIDQQNSGNIRNSYATGDVTVDRGRIGGFIAYIGSSNSGTIRNSYAAGDVSGGAEVGGFIGFIQDSGSGGISDSYARGRVLGSGANVGGFIGSFPDDGTRTTAQYVIASYWDTERSGRTNSDGGMPKTTAELKEAIIEMAGGIYEAWSRDDWDSGTRFDYPIIRFTEGDDPENPLCGGDERPCTVLAAQFTPLNQLVFLAGTKTSLSQRGLEPTFNPEHNMYRSTLRSNNSHVQFMIAAPTTRTVSYQVNDGGFIDLENSVGINPVALPPSPLAINLGTTTTIIIKVPPLETQANQDSGGEYTIAVHREGTIFLELKLFLEGALLDP